jgi:hypothetical protein
VGKLERSAVQGDGALIDAATVFLASGAMEKKRITTTTGWQGDGWIGSEARALLTVDAPSRLVLVAYAPRYIFSKAGTTGITLTLLLDGREIATRRVTADGPGAEGGVIANVQATVPAGGPAELVIRCGPLFEPKTLGVDPNDARQLCLLVDKLFVRDLETGE